MVCYAIRHNPSGLFLPAGRARGFTYDEPSSGIPRLFSKRKAAEMAMKCWLAGPWKKEYETDDWSGSKFTIGASAPDSPPENRKPEEMEIVTVIISLKKSKEVANASS